MGLLRGRHAEVMSPQNLREARRANDLPDLYILSGELEIEIDDKHYTALMDVSTNLPEDERRKIEREEGLLSP